MTLYPSLVRFQRFPNICSQVKYLALFNSLCFIWLPQEFVSNRLHSWVACEQALSSMIGRRKSGENRAPISFLLDQSLPTTPRLYDSTFPFPGCSSNPNFCLSKGKNQLIDSGNVLYEKRGRSLGNGIFSVRPVKLKQWRYLCRMSRIFRV